MIALERTHIPAKYRESVLGADIRDPLEGRFRKDDGRNRLGCHPANPAIPLARMLVISVRVTADSLITIYSYGMPHARQDSA